MRIRVSRRTRMKRPGPAAASRSVFLCKSFLTSRRLTICAIMSTACFSDGDVHGLHVGTVHGVFWMGMRSVNEIERAWARAKRSVRSPNLAARHRVSCLGITFSMRSELVGPATRSERLRAPYDVPGCESGRRTEAVQTHRDEQVRRHYRAIVAHTLLRIKIICMY